MAVESRFPIPASFPDLEHEPYNLLPYPNDFEDDDEAARADSFCQLVTLIERGNQSLLAGGLYLLQEQLQAVSAENRKLLERLPPDGAGPTRSEIVKKDATTKRKYAGSFLKKRF